MAIGELELLPAVRNTPPDWLVIANGFSCREQIAHGTDRHALHLAEVLQMAIQGASELDPYPERTVVRRHEAAVHRSMRTTALAVGGLAAGAALVWSLTRNH
jgi:hypothetical protein